MYRVEWILIFYHIIFISIIILFDVGTIYNGWPIMPSFALYLTYAQYWNNTRTIKRQKYVWKVSK